MRVPTMSDVIPQGMSHRLAARDGEVVDREAMLRFSFGGRLYTAFRGDTIAAALTAAGVSTFSRSFKYHRPRGLLCCSGHCPNCLVQIGDEPNVRACQRRVEEGMTVSPQNAWPSLERDALSLSGLLARFMPVGFYYKTFMRPRRLWPLFEAFLRRAAGLGRVDERSPHGAFDKQYLHADVAVVGGGPAGLQAARRAAAAGARVLLCDENQEVGGHLRFGGDPTPLAGARALLEEAGDIQVYTDTAVTGWYRDHWLAAVRGNRLFKIRAGAVVFATGAYERPLVFDNNDLPGVMLAGGVARLLQLYGVVPGKRAVVATANDDGWQVAEALVAAGVELAAVVDERGVESGTAATGLDHVPQYHGHVVAAAVGSGRVRSVEIVPLAGDRVDPGQRQTLPCDLLVTSGGWTAAADLAYMAGGKSRHDEATGETRLDDLPDGIFLAGRVNGRYSADVEAEDGRLAGAAAAAHAGYGEGPSSTAASQVETRAQQQPRRTSDCPPASGKSAKRFVCYCEDVTEVDVTTAIAEGFDSVELLKRYSTISMGPCQGKMCAANALGLCARTQGQTVAETGRTTSRPPVTPLTLGALAGQVMEPVQVTPLHQWHLDRGAAMMVAGLWLRPEHYGDPTAEVLAVRQRVGLIDVSTLGKIKLTGPGVPALLDRLYVNGWRKLGIGRVRYGVMCNDEGVILDDGVCARVREEEWYMSTTSSGAGSVHQWMEWWIQSGWGEGVQLSDVTDQHAAFNLTGPRARDVLQKLTERDLANDKLPYMRTRTATVAGAPSRLLRIGFTGELSFEIHTPASYGLQVWEALMEAGGEFGLVPFGVEAQRVLRLEKAHIIVGQDTDAMSDPLSADMDWAVKLDKADFLGQRELLRIHEKGRRQRLVGFTREGGDVVPEEGLQIVERREERFEAVGWVTSCRFSPVLQKVIGLCWLPDEVAGRQGETIRIHRNGRLVEAQIHHGPFYDPDGSRLKT